ncbi:hypothetical protein PG997_011627 [Apiospora hydei]|uniref:DNA-directed RNA polymerase subunit n=1 Tax=Apiospora hydei TaxID=1337664 RepID=A0ABR1VJL0_9PEZI
MATETKTKTKREHKSKKRIREGQEDVEGAEVQRRHKRSKSEMPEDVAEDQQSEQVEADEVEVPKKKRSKEEKDKKKKKKKDKHNQDTPDEAAPRNNHKMKWISTSSPPPLGNRHPENITEEALPFLQTDSPIDGYAEQHLKPLLNRYVREFKGVLLAYRNVRLGEAPNRGSLTEESEMADEALLETIDEYACGFGWLTAEVDLFRPSRGAPLEGVLNMATEGHMGVVCWGMFNAAIEAARLPKGWKWVSTLSKNRYKEFELPTPEPTEEGQDEEGEGEGEAAAEGEGGEAAATTEKEGDVTQLYSTGYWADEDGQKVEGTVQFRIKSFEVGQSGEYGYLSIEGTMLDAEEEQKQVLEELERKRRRDLRNGPSLWRKTRFLPDFSVTKFGADEEEEDQDKRAEVSKGSQPASVTAE